MSAALATAVVAGPGAPLAAAQVASGDVSAAVAAESPANRAIEVREGGLPLRFGSEGELVVQVQRALHVTADGIFGVQTDAAVRSFQRANGLDVDGIVGLSTWGSLFQSRGASGAAVGGSNIPAAAKQKVAATVIDAGRRLALQRGSGAPGLERAPSAAVPGSSGGPTTLVSAPGSAPTGRACGSATIIRPVSGPVTSDFGARWGSHHDGIDIGAASGTPVRAAACGTVSLAGQQSGYGNIVCITHTSQFSTCYAHLSRFAVRSGAHVEQGQVIGYVGCTGRCTGPHLHFETRVGGVARDPKPYLAGAPMPGQTTTTAKATATGASTGQAATVAGAGAGGATTTTAVAGAPAATPAAQPTPPADVTVTGDAETGTAGDGTVTASPGTDTSVTAALATAPAQAASASTAAAEAATTTTVPASTSAAEAATTTTVPVSTAPAEPVPTSPVPAQPADASAVPAQAAPAATPAERAGDAGVTPSDQGTALGDADVTADAEAGVAVAAQ